MNGHLVEVLLFLLCIRGCKLYMLGVRNYVFSSRLLFDGKVLQGLSIQRSLKVNLSVYVDLFFSLVCNQVQMMQEQM